MRAVETFLSRRAQTVWPDAVVYREEDGRFVLERAGAEALQLGASFPEAKRAVEVLRHAKKKEGAHGA